MYIYLEWVNRCAKIILTTVSFAKKYTDYSYRFA